MCALLYRVMESEIYLRADGTLTHRLDAGDEVRDLSEAPESAGPLYIGDRIRRLALFRSGDEDTGLKALKESVEIVSLGVDLLSFFQTLNNWLSNSPPGEDPNLRLLKELHAQMGQIADMQLASWATERQETVDALKADAYTALQTVLKLFKAADSGHTNVQALIKGNAYWGAKMQAADDDTLKVVQRLMSPGLWMRPYSVAALSTKGDPTNKRSGWMPNMADRPVQNAFKQVWDHRWALPTLLYAIGARVSVLRALRSALPEDDAQITSEIKGFIAFLSQVWIQMSDGLRQLRFENYSAEQKSWFGNSGYVPVFAVDINGGEFMGGTAFLHALRDPVSWWWTGPRPPKSMLTSDFTYSEPGAKAFALNVGAWAYGQVADSVGMTELLKFCAQLHVLIDPTRRLRFLDWQREFDDLISDEYGRNAALAAAHMAELNPALGEHEKSLRAFAAYDALRTDRDAAAEVVEKYTDELFRMGTGTVLGRKSRGRARWPHRKPATAA